MSSAIEKLPREQLAKMAKNMRKRARNEALDKERMKGRMLAVVIGGGAAYVTGFVMGGKQYEYEQNQAAIDAGTMEDPRKFAGVDLEILVGGVATLGGVALQGKSGSRKIGEGLEAAGLGVICSYAGQRGMQAGLEAAKTA